MIKVYDKYAKLDKIAGTSADISSQMAETRSAMSRMKPKIGRLSQTSKSSLMQNIAKDLNKQGLGTGGPSGMGGGGGDTWFSFPFSYDPSVSSMDRIWLPEDRREQNRYWRTFYASDPLVGNVLDMYAETPISEFTLSGKGVDGEIKLQYEKMCEECEILSTLIFLIKEFLIIGEVAPHCFFDKKQGIWTHITIHDPDRLEVFDSPLVDNDPIIELIPDEEMRRIFTSTDPRMIELRQRIPKEILNRLVSRMNIPLSNLNMTFIPRKAHPYYVRGMSILSRLFKIFIYEDAIYDASIATARRHAGPLKVVKLGDPTSGWLPEPGEEDRVAELLAQAELDPNAYLIYHYGINFSDVGTTDRIMNIGKEWDSIERMKLVGLGISKAFLTGEVTYASAEKGLEVWLSRILTLRQFFENQWLKPKFFKPIAQINKWYQPTEAEVSHRVRVKKGAEELERRLIIPNIEWQKTLKPAVDADKMDAYTALKDKGFIVSDRTVMSTAGLDFKDQVQMKKEEDAYLKKEGVERPQQGGMMGGGMGGTGLGGEEGGEGEGEETTQATPPAGEPGGQPVAPDGLPGVPAGKDDLIKEQEPEKDKKVIHFQKKDSTKDGFLIGNGNSSDPNEEDLVAEGMMEEMNGLGKVGKFETPDIDPPTKYKSREDWQKALHHAEIPLDAKNFIKSTENMVVDNWEKSFEGMWDKVKPMIDRDGVKVSESEVNGAVLNSLMDHLKKMDVDLLENNLTGIFHQGKLHSYEPLDFEKYKREKFGFKKIGVTISTMEDDLALRNMKDRLKDRLYNLTNSKVRDAITEKVKLALQEAIIKSSSAKEMKIALKKAYDDALWRFQQSVRTETTNNLVVANLLGYKEQGIKKVQWNPHHDARTCEKCRGMDGLEYEVDYLLSLGPYPLVAMTHYQCRCGISPVISHVEREKMITDLLSYKKKFPAPAKVSYPKNILKPVMTADGNTFKNVPLEYTKPIRTVSKKLGKIEHGDLFPKELEFVSDVADTAAFQKVYGKRDDLRNRVQYWKDKTGKVWVSNFYMTNKNPESAFLRIWAENIWSKVKEPWKKLYDKKMKPVLLPDLSVESATKMEASLEPVVAIPFRVGGVWGIALDKRFRTNNDDNVRTALKNLNLPDSDIETIVKWRNINPSWTMQGSSMEIGEKSLQEEGFVNETAKRSAKDMFTESVASFVGDGFLLDFRDPDSYKLLKKTIFKGREFK